MKKSITTVLVAFGFFLSVFLTSSAMAGGWGIGIIGAGANFSTNGSETEGGLGNANVFTTDNNAEKTTAHEDTNLLYGSIFAEYTFGEMYGMTLGVSYTPMKQTLGAKSRTDTETATEVADTGLTTNDAGTYSAEAKVSNHATIYIEPTFNSWFNKFKATTMNFYICFPSL